MNTLSSPIKTIAKYVLVIATVFAVLGNIVNWLTLYIGIGVSHGATLTFSALGFILGTVVSSAVLFAIFSVATVLGFVLYATIVNLRSKFASGSPSKPTDPKKNHAALKILLLALGTDLVLSLFMAIMNASALYAMLTAVSDKHALIMLDAVITGFLSFCVLIPGIGFVGAIAFLIFGFIALLIFGAGAKPKTKSNALSKVALLCLLALPLSMTGCALDGGGGVIVIDPSPCGGFSCPLPPPYFPGGPGHHGYYGPGGFYGTGGYYGSGGFYGPGGFNGGYRHGGYNSGGNFHQGSEHSGGHRH